MAMCRPEHTAPSYKRCCVGGECDFKSTPEQPCWGEVNAVDEIEGGDGEYWWVHACQGHSMGDGTYEPEPVGG